MVYDKKASDGIVYYNKNHYLCIMKTAIIGGGAAGFFCAINLAEMVHDAEIHIYEQHSRVLRKVEISGGGRCNCTNTFAGITDLRQAYPRGARLLQRLFHTFGPESAYRWFEQHGVPLTVQPDHCVFPDAQDSHAIIDCFMHYARKYNIHIHTDQRIDHAETLLQTFDNVVVTTGGQPRMGVPSLFTFRIDDQQLHRLMGIVVEEVTASLPATKFRASGPLLITHWGMSGPAILKLSSYAARHLATQNYRSPLIINWTGAARPDDVVRYMQEQVGQNPNRHVANLRPYGLQTNLWQYLLTRINLPDVAANQLNAKWMNRIANLLTADLYTIGGRSPYRDEFVTCGGIPLDEVDRQTLESRTVPHLYYAGEVLDIDGITGGFNFQAAWTTAYTVAQAIAHSLPV